MAMIAMTTSSSIRVKPRRQELVRVFIGITQLSRAREKRQAADRPRSGKTHLNRQFARVLGRTVLYAANHRFTLTPQLPAAISPKSDCPPLPWIPPPRFHPCALRRAAQSPAQSR